MRKRNTQTEERSGFNGLPELPKSTPAMEFQTGRVRGSIWKNMSQKGAVYYKVSIRRVETNGEESWLSNSFFPEDLRHVAAVSTACRIWLQDNTQAFQGREKSDAKPKRIFRRKSKAAEAEADEG